MSTEDSPSNALAISSKKASPWSCRMNCPFLFMYLYSLLSLRMVTGVPSAPKRSNSTSFFAGWYFRLPNCNLQGSHFHPVGVAWKQWQCVCIGAGHPVSEKYRDLYGQTVCSQMPVPLMQTIHVWLKGGTPVSAPPSLWCGCQLRNTVHCLGHPLF